MQLLLFLEDMAGGHGMGVATWRDDKPFLTKGVDMGVDEAMALMGGDTKCGWLFHTRIMTSGAKIDPLCQPFNYGEWLVTHNGHWTDWKHAYWGLLLTKRIKITEPMNDSRTMAALVAAVGSRVVWEATTGVFLTWRKGQTPICSVVGGNFQYSSLARPKGGMVYASAFPGEWPHKVYDFKDGTAAAMLPEGPKMVYGEAPKLRLFAPSRMVRGNRHLPAHLRGPVN